MKLSPDCPIDLPKLLETRMLAVANSGAGKSHLIRKLLEETAPHVQQIVIDPEGEFATLRERFDYVICAPHGGDVVAHPSTAALLARRLLETGLSAILNIYELKAHERLRFVRLFLEEMVNAPKALWRPVMIILDEAHVFCPEKGKAESLQAVIDLATRGRKRGYCLVMATQRLSKLHKDAAAEMINKAIGRTGLDIDVKRAADELGLPPRDATERLRSLAAGEFYVYGPAFSEAVKKTKIGPVLTTHPQSGGRLLASPPPPSAKVKAALAKGLQDIPKEAAVEARTLAEVRAELTKVRTQLTHAEKRAATAGIPEAEVQRRIAAAVRAEKPATTPAPQMSKVRQFLKKALEAMDATAFRNEDPAPGESRKTYPNPGARLPPRNPEVVSTIKLRAGAVRILQELAARVPAGYSHAQVATLTGFSPNGGTFKTYVGDLKRSDAIEIRDGLVYATRAGVESLGGSVPPKPTTHEEVMALWRGALRAGAFRMLEQVVGNPAGIDREALAAFVGMEAGGGTFKTYLGDLKRNGLIEERNGFSRPSAILQCEGNS